MNMTDALMKIAFLDRDTISLDTTLRAPSFAHEWVQYQGNSADAVFST